MPIIKCAKCGRRTTYPAGIQEQVLSCQQCGNVLKRPLTEGPPAPPPPAEEGPQELREVEPPPPPEPPPDEEVEHEVQDEPEEGDIVMGPGLSDLEDQPDDDITEVLDKPD